MSFSPASLPVNENGGYYQPGSTYGLGKKLEVYDAYCELIDSTWPLRPSVRDVASKAKVTKSKLNVNQYITSISPAISCCNTKTFSTPRR